MIDARRGKPACCYPIHALPRGPVPLTPAAERPLLVAEQVILKRTESAAVARHTVIPVMSLAAALHCDHRRLL